MLLYIYIQDILYIGLHTHKPKEICCSEIEIICSILLKIIKSVILREKHDHICNGIGAVMQRAAHVGLSSSPQRPQERLKDK